MNYDNGEPITAARIQEESWYADYQALMEIAVRSGATEVPELVRLFNADYREIFGKDFADQKRLGRWSVLHAKRNRELRGDPDV